MFARARTSGNLAFISKDISMRILHSGGYSRHQYSPELLRAKAQLVAAHIPRLLKHYNADAIVVTGKSGHSVAFAAMMLVDFPLCVVRKETDQSHGTQVEGADGTCVHRYLILDDFVASGNTVRNICETMDDSGMAECVGVIEYSECDECWEYDECSGIAVFGYEEPIRIINLMRDV